MRNNCDLLYYLLYYHVTFAIKSQQTNSQTLVSLHFIPNQTLTASVSSPSVSSTSTEDLFAHQLSYTMISPSFNSGNEQPFDENSKENALKVKSQKKESPSPLTTCVHPKSQTSTGGIRSAWSSSFVYDNPSTALICLLNNTHTDCSTFQEQD